MSQNSFADSTVISLNQAAQSIPKELERQGYSDVGQLNLHRLLLSMNHAHVSQVEGLTRPQVIIAGETFSRSSAQWQVNQQGKTRILVNQSLWAKTDPTARPVIGLHENLGALGFHDENYQLSSAMWALSQFNSGLADAEKVNIVSQIEKSAEGGGGIVGVGGGAINMAPV